MPILQIRLRLREVKSLVVGGRAAKWKLGLIKSRAKSTWHIPEAIASPGKSDFPIRCSWVVWVDAEGDPRAFWAQPWAYRTAAFPSAGSGRRCWGRFLLWGRRPAGRVALSARRGPGAGQGEPPSLLVRAIWQNLWKHKMRVPLIDPGALAMSLGLSLSPSLSPIFCWVGSSLRLARWPQADVFLALWGCAFLQHSYPKSQECVSLALLGHMSILNQSWDSESWDVWLANPRSWEWNQQPNPWKWESTGPQRKIRELFPEGECRLGRQKQPVLMALLSP